MVDYVHSLDAAFARKHVPRLIDRIQQHVNMNFSNLDNYSLDVALKFQGMPSKDRLGRSHQSCYTHPEQCEGQAAVGWLHASR